jgi:pimeloyl-ACP methyl ester carboxylesterase
VGDSAQGLTLLSPIMTETFVAAGPLRLRTERTGNPDHPAVPMGHAEALAAAIPHARLHVVPGMGHSFFAPGLPEELADLITLDTP